MCGSKCLSYSVYKQTHRVLHISTFPVYLSEFWITLLLDSKYLWNIWHFALMVNQYQQPLIYLLFLFLLPLFFSFFTLLSFLLSFFHSSFFSSFLSSLFFPFFFPSSTLLPFLHSSFLSSFLLPLIKSSCASKAHFLSLAGRAHHLRLS